MFRDSISATQGTCVFFQLPLTGRADQVFPFTHRDQLRLLKTNRTLHRFGRSKILHVWLIPHTDQPGNTGRLQLRIGSSPTVVRVTPQRPSSGAKIGVEMPLRGVASFAHVAATRHTHELRLLVLFCTVPCGVWFFETTAGHLRIVAPWVIRSRCPVGPHGCSPTGHLWKVPTSKILRHICSSDKFFERVVVYCKKNAEGTFPSVVDGVTRLDDQWPDQ